MRLSSPRIGSLLLRSRCVQRLSAYETAGTAEIARLKNICQISSVQNSLPFYSYVLAAKNTGSHNGLSMMIKTPNEFGSIAPTIINRGRVEHCSNVVKLLGFRCLILRVLDVVKTTILRRTFSRGLLVQLQWTLQLPYNSPETPMCLSSRGSCLRLVCTPYISSYSKRGI